LKLTPDPQRASFLRSEFRKGIQGNELEVTISQTLGIAPRIWPNMFMVLAVSTGDFEFYKQKLQFYTSSIPIYSPIYGATEGLLGKILFWGISNHFQV
jgi:auxin responsive GH3 family protein